MFVDMVKYLQEKLNQISPNSYVVSNERNIDADYEKNQVIVSALSGNVYEESASIPYQIDIITNDIESVMADFIILARDNNNVTFNNIVKSGDEYESYSITAFFNTPVVMDKEIQIGSDKYARIVVFCNINAVFNVSNIKKLKIDNEEIKFMNANIIYTAELISNRVSGDELNRSKKKTSSSSITVSMINKSSVFTNKLLRIVGGSISGNSKFSVEVEMENNMKLEFSMVLGSYTLSSARQSLPSINFALFMYDERGDSNA